MRVRCHYVDPRSHVSHWCLCFGLPQAFGLVSHLFLDVLSLPESGLQGI